MNAKCKDGEMSSDRSNDLNQVWLAYQAFETLVFNGDEEMDSFTQKWRASLDHVVSMGCSYSDLVLAFKLLDRCNLKPEELSRILEQITYPSEDKSLLNQAVAQLTCLCPRVPLKSNKNGLKHRVDVSIKVEETEAIAERCNASSELPQAEVLLKKAKDLPANEVQFTKAGISSKMLSSGVTAERDQDLHLIEEKAKQSSVKGRNKVCHECTVCGKAFRRKGTYNRHLTLVHKDVVLKIEAENQASQSEYLKLSSDLISSKVFSSEDYSQNEVLRPEQQPGEAQPIINLQALNVKANDNHNPSVTTPNVKTSLKKRRRPQIIHHTCETCGKTCNSLSAKIYHFRLHNNIRNYACTTCQKTFLTQFHLDAHEKRHRGDKPWVCEACGHSFVTKYALKSHERTHSGEKVYTCQECGKSFSHPSSFSWHKKVHSESRPYKCQKCPQTFKRPCNLIEHAAIHDGVKRYPCGVCSRAFIRNSTRRRHMRTHVGVDHKEEQDQTTDL